jgi:catechol 2,3-dioxygenase-like lactoylglutathione lyase family enzyme
METLRKIVGFLNTAKPDDSKTFYSEILGFRFVRDDNFALVFDANGTTIRIVKAQAFTRAHGTVLGWEVDDMTAAVDELTGRGVVFEQFDLPFIKQDGRGVWTTPDGGEVAWFRDPDGNLLSISTAPGA